MTGVEVLIEVTLEAADVTSVGEQPVGSDGRRILADGDPDPVRCAERVVQVWDALGADTAAVTIAGDSVVVDARMGGVQVSFGVGVGGSDLLVAPASR